MLMFEEFSGKRWGCINLNTQLQHYIREGVAEYIATGRKSPMLAPASMQAFVAMTHSDFSVDASYGGWREWRSVLWRGSYLEGEKKFIHLGVDFSVPAGTIVSLPFDGEVLHCDDDSPSEQGWGPRIFLRHPGRNCVLLFAHLAKINHAPGKKLCRGMSLAQVGESSGNGGWWPHLHVQAMTEEAYQRHQSESFANLDGYCSKAGLRQAVKDFLDPLPVICPF